MDDPLVRFLYETGKSLAALSASERERRMERISSDLERLLGEYLLEGYDESSAISLAISGTRRVIDDGTPPPTAACPVAMPVRTAALRSAAAYCVWGWVTTTVLNTLARWWFPDSQQFMGQLGTFGMHAWNVAPSTVAAGAALMILAVDGKQDIRKGFVDQSALSWPAVRWIAMRHQFGLALWIIAMVLIKGLMAVSPNGDLSCLTPWFLGALAVTIVMVPIVPLTAGWLARKASPDLGLAGVKIAAAVSIVLCMADAIGQCWHSLPDSYPTLVVYLAFQGCLNCLGVLGASMADRAPRAA